MKKLFFVFAIASLGFVACNDEKKPETPEVTPEAVPAPAPQDTTAAAPQDTTVAAPAPAAN